MFSIGATHDYLSWNRARWEAVDYSHQELKLNPTEINGGFEYKKWFSVNFNRPLGYQGLENWNDPREKYIISHTEQCLFTTVKIFPYNKYFPPKKDLIYLQKKSNFSLTDTITCGAELISEGDQSFITNQKNIQLGNIERRVSQKAHSGNYSILLEANNPYGFTFTLKNLLPCEKILVSTWKLSSVNAVKGVIKMKDGLHLENPHFIEERNEAGWVKQVQEFTIPKNIKTDEASFFLYNPSSEKVYFDDLMIVRIK